MSVDGDVYLRNDGTVCGLGHGDDSGHNQDGFQAGTLSLAPRKALLVRGSFLLVHCDASHCESHSTKRPYRYAGHTARKREASDAGDSNALVFILRESMTQEQPPWKVHA